jgi:orotidine-5'-phosphate decarboxylase
MPGTPPIYVALDTADLAQARALGGALGRADVGLKLGLEFFAAQGPQGVARMAAPGRPIFLDLKLHDIPNTVAAAIRAVLPLKPRFVTVHAAGSPAQLAAAAQAARDGGAERPKLLAVTVLTSFDDADLAATGQIGPVGEQVLRLARHAIGCGIDGLVCSPLEIAALRGALGPAVPLVTPGIRPAWAAAGDQKRVMTPAEAIAAGADHLVIGRPITAAPDPAAAAARILAELR